MSRTKNLRWRHYKLVSSGRLLAFSIRKNVDLYILIYISRIRFKSNLEICIFLNVKKFIKFNEPFYYSLYKKSELFMTALFGYTYGIA